MIVLAVADYFPKGFGRTVVFISRFNSGVFARPRFIFITVNGDGETRRISLVDLGDVGAAYSIVSDQYLTFFLCNCDEIEKFTSAYLYSMHSMDFPFPCASGFSAPDLV